MRSSAIPCRWRIAERTPAREAALAEALAVPRVIARLLLARGIETAEAGQRFLRPDLSILSDPYDLTDMAKSVDRIHEARMAGEHVRVFGDYDVDGITGTALLTRALNRMGVTEVSYALPSRMVDGYGINEASVAQAKDDGVDLLITVDNGISAHGAAEAARKLGVDLIVTDHHAIDTALPDALAVVNPKRECPESPLRDLSGSAVALKLAMALEDAAHDLDLVALGTVADIVPLQGENRVLVAAGVESMRQSPRTGLNALARVSRIRMDELRAENIAFQLGPRINAAGRLGDGTVGVRLLLTSDDDEAITMASELDSANTERRSIEQGIFEEAQAQLEDGFDPDTPAIVLAGKGWHHGVIGIVASRLQSAYCRPVVLIAVDEDGVGRSSARSSAAFNLIEGLATCKDLLEKYGGHHAAAGMTIREEHIEAFRERFLGVATERLGAEPITRELNVDAAISFTDIDAGLLRTLEAMEPFGQSNPAPVFCTYDVEVLPHSVRELRGGHLRFTVRQAEQVFTAIGFGMAERVQLPAEGAQVDLAYSPRFNTWRGETTIQLQLKDVQFSGK